MLENRDAMPQLSDMNATLHRLTSVFSDVFVTYASFNLSKRKPAAFSDPILTQNLNIPHSFCLCGQARLRSSNVDVTNHCSTTVVKAKQATVETKEDVRFYKLARREGWNRCPRCHYYIEKVGGCTQVHCIFGMVFTYEADNFVCRYLTFWSDVFNINRFMVLFFVLGCITLCYVS